MKVGVLVALFFLQLPVWCFAQSTNTVRVALIPDSLKKNATAVVRNHATTYKVKSANLATELVEKTVTVIDKKGIPLANFYYPGDQFRKLTAFSASVYDAEGRLLKKYKLTDVRTSDYSDELASDDKSYTLSCEVPTLPYTVAYLYEITWKNISLQYPTFYPVPAPHISVERASYSLELDDTTRLMYKTVHLPRQPSKKVVKDRVFYYWSVNGLKAIVSERMMPDIDSLVPFVYIRPQSFVYDRVKGTVPDWKSMGLWENGLLKGRDALSPDEVTFVKSVTDTLKTAREKVSVLYDYLGRKTHYVSIQLGIGGYQPIPAMEVSRTQFGDCKALTNYFKALLAASGVQSHYCSVFFGSGNETLLKDYPGFNQMNHVILQVPLPADTLWVECTNPRLPLGFIHEGIAGHEALVLTDQGGIIQRLPDYADSLTLESNTARVLVQADGGGSANSTLFVQSMAYDALGNFAGEKPEVQVDYLRRSIKLPNATVSRPVVVEHKSANPNFTITFNWQTTAYGTKSGNRLFVPINPFSAQYEWLKSAKRDYPLCIKRGFKDVDSVELIIPPGYAVENCPTSISLNAPFGRFCSSIEMSDGSIRVVQSLTIYRGTVSQRAFPTVVDFFTQVSKAYGASIILVKKN